MPDQLGDLRESAAALCAAVPAPPSPAERFTGAAASATVVVDGDGTVCEVRIAPGRQAGRDVDGLGVALLQAWSAAMLQRLQGWLGPQRTGTPAQHAVRRPGTGPDPGVRATAVPLSRAVADLREFELALRERREHDTACRSSDGLVTVVVRRGQVQRVVVDDRQAPGSAIASAATGAFRAASATTAGAARDALAGCPDLAALLVARGALPRVHR